MRIRMGWQAAAAGAVVGAIFVVHDVGAAGIDSPEGIVRLSWWRSRRGDRVRHYRLRGRPAEAARFGAAAVARAEGTHHQRSSTTPRRLSQSRRSAAGGAKGSKRAECAGAAVLVGESHDPISGATARQPPAATGGLFSSHTIPNCLSTRVAQRPESPGTIVARVV
jgi:hypothetical protein